MGRKANWPPRVTRHKASGQDRCRHLDKTYYLGPAGSAESRRRYAELLQTLTPPGEPKTGWITVGEIAAQWLLERGQAHSPKELASYDAVLGVLLAEGRSGLTADRFSVATLAQCRKAMLARDWCRNVVNRQVSRVRTIWRWAEESGLMPPGSWAHLRSLRPLPVHDRSVRHTERVRPATQADIEAVAGCLVSPAVRAMLWLQWWSACRPGEARKMRAGEVDRSGEVWLYRPASHKNAWRGHERVIPLGPQAQAVLSPLLEGLPPGESVFRSRNGRPYGDSSYAGMVGRAAKKAGLGWLCPLSLRHGARLRITREVNLEAARAVLGHTTANMSLRYGAGVDVETAREAARRAG